VALIVVGCEKENFEIKSLIVADHKVDCVREEPQKCLLIRENENQQWQYFYGVIEGFNYEESFEYVIEVKIYDVENPPADGSGKRYVLKRIISKK
jgi:hypothetical protein